MTASSPMDTAREALEKMWHRDDCTMSLDHPDQCSCGFLQARAALNALSPSVSDTVNAGLVEALKPFAEFADSLDPESDDNEELDYGVGLNGGHSLFVADFRLAERAYQAVEPNPPISPLSAPGARWTSDRIPIATIAMRNELLKEYDCETLPFLEDLQKALIAALSTLNASPPAASEPDETALYRATATFAESVGISLGRPIPLHWVEGLRQALAALSRGEAAEPDAATAWHDGFLAGLGVNPWDDASDWAILTGQSYARGEGMPPMPKPSLPHAHHPEAGAPSREEIARKIAELALGVAWDTLPTDRADWRRRFRGTSVAEPGAHQDELLQAADAIFALFHPDKAVLGGMGERVARIASDMNLVLSQAWDEEQDRDWGAATDELKLDRLDELLGNLLALLSERHAAEEDHSSRAVPLKTISEGWTDDELEPAARALFEDVFPEDTWDDCPGLHDDVFASLRVAIAKLPLPANPALPQDVEGGEL